MLLCGCLFVLAIAAGPARAQPCQFSELLAQTCGGKCALGQTCAKTADGTQCKCQPTYTCKYNPDTLACGGSCPQGQTCAKTPTSECKCQLVVAYTCKYNPDKLTCGG